ncbi:hypothetical protein MKW98_022741 [Papaver atlanticum]|uniref:Uncharacterized protein n=1 Tax=Papaver atlanticum TaxID=357466 RepID=A0AAD4TM68_9MAGN|nr:hypothetical protein MKW98_022741 [Papaver atlanticum]
MKRNLEIGTANFRACQRFVAYMSYYKGMGYSVFLELNWRPQMPCGSNVAKRCSNKYCYTKNYFLAA